MTLREDLKNYVPMYLWEKIEHPEGFVVSNEEYNMRWNLLQVQGDHQATTIRDILKLLYDTLLNDLDGASHIKISMVEYTATNLQAALKEIDTKLKADATALTNHKISGDHDDRYYTRTQLSSGQLDERYYTKLDLLPWLRGGDTNIKEEVFTIIAVDNGDGTFTYSKDGMPIIGVLSPEGYQQFIITDGTYTLNSNRLEVIINDTLRRSVASGGVVEINETSFALTQPEGVGTEVTVKYYERIGMSAEYNIKVGITKPPANNGKNMWFKIKE